MRIAADPADTERLRRLIAGRQRQRHRSRPSFGRGVVRVHVHFVDGVNVQLVVGVEADLEIVQVVNLWNQIVE